MNRKLLVIIILITTLLFVFFTFRKSDLEVSKTSKNNSNETLIDEKTDLRAKFEIRTNGTRRIFTDPKYHNKSVDVYVNQEDPSVIYVKKQGVKWSDFFSTLPMKLDKKCLVTGTKQTFCTGSDGTLRFFINSLEDNDVLDREIREGDFLLVTFSK